MNDQTIICPNCRTEIPLSQALSERIRGELQADIAKDFAEKEKQLATKLETLSEREEEITHEKNTVDQIVADKLLKERKKIEESANEQATRAVGIELEDLRSTLKERDEQLEETQKHELELRKRERKLEDEKKQIELDVQRKLDLEREVLRKETVEQIQQSHDLETGDLKKRIQSLTEQIDTLKRKAEQGSQEAQGEVQEIQLEDLLTAAFPKDSVQPVPKGKKGADVIQEIYNDSGHMCGTIIWESKRTKSFNQGWIEKLKSDQRDVKAEIAAIYTQVLPDEVVGCGELDGVWITGSKSLIGLATALRSQLIQVSNTRIAAVGKNQKVELLYAYLTGPEFKGRVEAIVEAFSSLRSDLDSERRAMTRIWAKREKQIQKVIENTSGMYGDMQGIVGATLPEIDSLQIAALPGLDNDAGEIGISDDTNA